MDAPGVALKTLVFLLGLAVTIPGPARADAPAAVGSMGLGGCRSPSPLLTPGNFLPFILDTLPASGSGTYQFQLGTVGGFSYPLALVLKLDS